ncbi:hypothetical protein MUCCIDRAFT_154681, partial [Mucor lusitanicus CBS 277.49]
MYYYTAANNDLEVTSIRKRQKLHGYLEFLQQTGIVSMTTSNSNYCLTHKVYYTTTWCPYCGHNF